jgi:hypothetical protein
MCFVWISEQTAIISLYNINWLVFINKTLCVYCAVRTECLYIFEVNFLFYFKIFVSLFSDLPKSLAQDSDLYVRAQFVSRF